MPVWNARAAASRPVDVKVVVLPKSSAETMEQSKNWPLATRINNRKQKDTRIYFIVTVASYLCKG